VPRPKERPFRTAGGADRSSETRRTAEGGSSVQARERPCIVCPRKEPTNLRAHCRRLPSGGTINQVNAALHETKSEYPQEWQALSRLPLLIGDKIMEINVTEGYDRVLTVTVRAVVEKSRHITDATLAEIAGSASSAVSEYGDGSVLKLIGVEVTEAYEVGTFRLAL
jgi:hypothetical protein